MSNTEIAEPINAADEAEKTLARLVYDIAVRYIEPQKSGSRKRTAATIARLVAGALAKPTVGDLGYTSADINEIEQQISRFSAKFAASGLDVTNTARALARQVSIAAVRATHARMAAAEAPVEPSPEPGVTLQYVRDQQGFAVARRRYEHQCTSGSLGEMSIAKLDEQGAKGWELVQIAPSYTTGSETWFFWKREIVG